MFWAFKIPLIINILGIIGAIYINTKDSIFNPIMYKNAMNILTVILCIWVAISYFLYQKEYKTLGIVFNWIPAALILFIFIFLLGNLLRK
jgi:uncharacterized PurR-regulated membrane protein YhhQ (DUF165 family)